MENVRINFILDIHKSEIKLRRFPFEPDLSPAYRSGCKVVEMKVDKIGWHGFIQLKEEFYE